MCDQNDAADLGDTGRCGDASSAKENFQSATDDLDHSDCILPKSATGRDLSVVRHRVVLTFVSG